jgi:diguanylate cyclase (GGDEF)-like protein
VTLIQVGEPPQYIAASDPSARRFEQLQSEFGEGPCLLAYQSGRSVSVPDLSVETRFPNFCTSAREAGLAAVFTFPLRHGRGRALGALDVYRDAAGPMSEHAMDVAQTLADVVAAYLLNAKSREETERAAASSLHSSLHDALTALPNRVLLQERLQHAALRARRSHAAAAVLFIDLDRFKDVNDNHGHHVGDQLLVAVAKRLSGLVRPGDTLSRVSGDEFVFLCEDLSCENDAQLIAARITEAFAEPFLVGPLRLVATASVGIAYAGPGEEISDQLTIDADTAMYRAKHSGGHGHQAIDLREALHSTQRNNLEIDLRAAMADGSLAIAYQPIVRSADGLVTGVEALLRWTHPDQGSISPLLAIGIAEQSELINDIGQWVLEQSSSDRARWLRDFPQRPLDLSVNVSGRQLLSNGFRGIVDNTLSATGTNPTTLILELTENVFIEDNERAMTILTDLKALGVRLALDDFGTGFSSLSYLRRLPVDIVKIDRLFVSDIAERPQDGAIVKAVTDLSHALGLTVIAEGIETKAQRDRISQLGCDSSQGYYYAKPMSASALSKRLVTSNTYPLCLPTQRTAANIVSHGATH